VIRGIDHIAVVVADIEDATRQYETVLGLPLVHDERLEALNVRLAYVGAGEHLVQLVQPLGDGPLARFLATRGEGLHHYCLQVDDIDAALDELSDAANRPAVVTGGRGRRACFLPLELNGVPIELTEPAPFEIALR